MSPTTVLSARVDTDRADQLRQLAQERGLTVSDLLDDLVSKAILDAGDNWNRNRAWRTEYRMRIATCDDWKPANGDDRLEINRGRICCVTGIGLGLCKPIALSFVAPQALNEDGRTLGTHRFDGKRHTIRIATGLSADEAADTLRHEIGHAIQKETLDTASLTRLFGGPEWKEEFAESYVHHLRMHPMVRYRADQGQQHDGAAR